jgi:hypothetical protein
MFATVMMIAAAAVPASTETGLEIVAAPAERAIVT